MLKHPFEQELHAAFKQYNHLVKKDYLYQLSCAKLIPHASYSDHILLFKINSIVATTISSFFTYVFNSLASLETTITFILDKRSDTLNFYIGLRFQSSPTINSEILTQGFLATFASSTLTPLDEEASAQLLAQIFSSVNFSAITNTIVIPNNTSALNTPLLEKFTALFSAETYTALFLATPTAPCENERLIDELICLYNTLSQFTQTNHNLAKGVAHNTSCTHTTNESDSCGDSCTHTDNTSQGSSTAHYENLTPSTTVPIGDSSRSVNVSMTFNNACGANQGTSCGVAKGENSSHSHGDSEAHLKATNLSDNNTLIYVKQNKAVSDALATLTLLITRLNNESSNALFYFSAFFLSSFTSTSIRAGYTYAGLAKDPTLNLEPAFVTTWSYQEPAFEPLLTELQYLHIPKFNMPRSSKSFKAATTITSNELLNTFYFPFSSTEQ